LKVIKQILTYILGNKDEFTFEERMMLSYLLYASVICFVSIFINVGLNLGIGTIALVAFSFVFFSILFILGRFYKKENLIKVLFSIYTLFFCNFYWYSNYGSRGSAQFFFLIYFFIMIFVWNTFQIMLIASFVILNIAILFILEISNPNLILQYPTEFSRISDSYVTLIIALGFFSIIIVSAKNNYIKQYKMAQRSDKLKSAFLANMSHEIRTPLNAIMGFTKLLTTRELSKEKMGQYSNLITDNSKYLMQLLSDILDISLIESGQLKLNPSLVKLQDLFNRLYENQNYILKDIKKENVHLQLSLPSDNATIETDVVRFEQIMTNLLNNAVKFTSDGYIKFGYYLQENEYVFFVEDTGCGIKEEFQPEIFNRFVKNEDNRDANFIRGAGIGLSLTKELVHILGGKIWFTSVYMEGTTFYFTLPIKINK